MEYRITRSEDYLQHHGILGQKWGVRRFQNPDGTLTAEGKKRYANSLADTVEKRAKKYKGFVPSYSGLERESKRLQNNPLVEEITKKMAPQFQASRNAENRISNMPDDVDEDTDDRAIRVANKIYEKWRTNLRNEISDAFNSSASNLDAETIDLGRRFVTHTVLNKFSKGKYETSMNIAPKDQKQFTKLQTTLMKKDSSGELSEMASELYAVGYSMKEIEDILGV